MPTKPSTSSEARFRYPNSSSASPDLLRQSSESLAGRLETVYLEGFQLADLGAGAQGRHWLRGGFPLAYTARNKGGFDGVEESVSPDVPRARLAAAWRYDSGACPAAFLEHDLFIIIAKSGTDELACALSVGEPTVRRYLDLMANIS